MNSEFIQTLITTGKLAFWTTLILFLLGLPIAYFLAFSKFRLKAIIEALISMPMVLPPTVLGFYILVAYSPQNWFGKMMEQWFNVRLAFSFSGILIASILCSLPFMIQPLQNGLMALSPSLKEAAYTMGKSRLTTFLRVLLPNIRNSIIIATTMTFAHTVGEFGIVLMVGGNMPGATRVASIALYDQVQALNYKEANQYALILFVVSFLVLTIVYSIHKKTN
ncbi:MAG: molybdate ABC transporter permease subunit [Bacteroidaceae bacterium]|nr:molybdate ABC transporter permease subunit [Bacteroidaceae bacterium]MBP9636796.1 molybdate ABC transporter permease subunit [Bacteroidaceae bacterium]